MTKDEMRSELSGILSLEDPQLDVPTVDDWRRLEARFGMVFPTDFKSFIELMAEFSFPGDIFNVSRTGQTNGNDLIEVVYDTELEGGWPQYLVPFFGIGNGDYFALDSREGSQSGVYYRYHEDSRIERYSKSFEDWIRTLPSFLKAES
jgi:hypothetical protein